MKQWNESALRFLVAAGAELASSLDYEATLTAVTQQAVPTLADWCALDLLDDDGTLRRLSVAHPDPAMLALAHELEARYPEDPTSPTGSYARLRSKRTEWAASIPDELLVQAARDKEHLRMIRAIKLHSYISVPLVIRDEAVGLLTLVMAESGREYREHDVSVAEELGRRASMAIDHARTHQRALDTAARLEQQTHELEMQAVQLTDQAIELETQQLELESQTTELVEANDSLNDANAELIAATTRALEAEGFVRGILESIVDPMVVYDAEWRVRYSNSSGHRALARSGGDGILTGRVLWEVFPDLIGSEFERQMRAAAAARAPITFVAQRHSSIRWTEVRCYPLADGGLAAVWKDVTDQKETEDRLRFLARASEILASSLDYEKTIRDVARLVVPELADWCTVDLLDENGAIRQLAVEHVDPAKVTWARELQRRYPADPDAAGVGHVIRTGESELHSTIPDELLRAGARDPEHYEILRELGLTSVIVVPLQARDRVLGALSLVSAEGRRTYTEADLTLARELGRRAAVAVDNAALYDQAIRARNAAESAREQAEEANTAKAAFLAHMSHELRTPLNAIGGYAELLQMGVRGKLTEAQLSDLDRIQRSQRHLLALINDVLNYAKIEAGHVQFAITDFAASEALHDLEMLFAPQLQKRRHRYVLEATDPGLTLRADRDKVEQILLNLLSNAVKFTPDGGTIHVSAVPAGPMVELRVKDSGVGIPPERVESVFEPFVQLRSSTDGGEGTGLGLAISRDLARGMHGDLVVDSAVGAGSTFTVRLPAGGARARA